MSASVVFAFWAVALLLIVVPGADWAFTLGAGAGGRSVVPAVSGLVLGYTAMTAIVAAGVGALVAASPAALTGLTVAGGLYLVWHGAMTLARPSRVHAGTTAPGADRAMLLKADRAMLLHEDRAMLLHEDRAMLHHEDRAMLQENRAMLLRGIGVSGLNPKGLLIFLALLPQFTSPHARWPVAVQTGLLGLVFTATCAVFYLCLGTFARAVLHARPAAARAVGGVCGAAMILIGVALLADRLIA